MRVAFVLDTFPLMSENFILRQITGLIDLGHDVRVLAGADSGEVVRHDAVARYGLAQRVNYAPARGGSRFSRNSALAMLAARRLACHPIRTWRVLRGGMRSAPELRRRALAHGLGSARDSYDVLHCHFGPAGMIGLVLKRAGIGRVLVTSFHGYDVTSWVERHGRDVYRDLFQEGDLFTYNSEATKERLLRLGAPAERMAKLPMGVDLESVPWRARTVAPGERIVVVSVGRLVEMKGREYAMRAMAEVMHRHQEVSYVIVGDGPLRGDLEVLRASLGMTDRIQMPGWLTDAALARLYQEAHIMLHPSVTASDGNQEGQGVVLVEAQAHGLPVVATRHGAFAETVREGASGYLAPERDAAALARYIEELVTHPETWPALGIAGRAHVQAEYDQGHLNRRLEGLYAGLFEHPALVSVTATSPEKRIGR